MTWREKLSRLHARLRAEPFVRLVQHFVLRVARGDSSPLAEFQFGPGPLLGLLAAPGAFQAILLLPKYSRFLDWYLGRLKTDPLVMSAGDKYTFLCIAMAVVGIVAVLKWDRILPDAKDYLNLAPLPVSRRTIVTANLTAIAIVAAVLTVTVNTIPGLLFPAFVASYAQPGAVDFQKFVGVHYTSVVLASLCSFLSVFAILGTASALPHRVFDAVSPWLRAVLLAGFVVLLMTGFAGRAVMPYLEWLPAGWFLGLYQVLHGRGTPRMMHLASWAWWSLGSALAVMAASYVIAYRRRFAAILEGRPRPYNRLWSILLAVFNCFAPRRQGFPRALYQFSIRVLLRNDAQRLCASIALILGLLFAGHAITILQMGPRGSLAVPLIVAYMLLAGLRLAIELPANAPAAWMFQSILDPREQETRGVVRRIMLAFLSLTVLFPMLAWRAWEDGLATGLLQTGYVLALCLCLMEVLLWEYRKIPFACYMPPFRQNFPVMLLLNLLGFLFFADAGSKLEQWMLDQPLRFLWVPIAMFCIWWWKRKQFHEAIEAGEAQIGISFENRGEPVIELLHLSGAD